MRKKTTWLPKSGMPSFGGKIIAVAMSLGMVLFLVPNTVWADSSNAQGMFASILGSAGGGAPFTDNGISDATDSHNQSVPTSDKAQNASDNEDTKNATSDEQGTSSGNQGQNENLDDQTQKQSTNDQHEVTPPSNADKGSANDKAGSGTNDFLNYKVIVFNESYEGGNSAKKIACATKSHGQFVQLPKEDHYVPTRPGHRFMGWATSPDALNSDLHYQPGAIADISSAGDEPVFYAQWNKVLSFSSNAEDFSGQTANLSGLRGEALTIPECGFIRDGYNFAQWNTKPDGTGDSYMPGKQFMLTAGEDDVTLFAQWTPKDSKFSYKVALMDDNYSSGRSAYKVLCPTRPNGTAAELQLPEATQYLPTREGYTFVGWSLTAESGGLVFTPGAWVATRDNMDSVTYYAQWKADAKSLFLDRNCMDAKGNMDDISGFTDQNVSVPTCAYTRQGYTFVGWNTESDGSGTAYTMGGQFKLCGNDNLNTLYAQWQANSDIQLIFLPNGGEGDKMAPLSGNTGDNVVVPDCTYTRAGYKFIGWMNADGNMWQPNMSYTLQSDPRLNVLYASWKAEAKALVYNANAEDARGTMNSTAGVTDETVTVASCGFTREGYDFAGWNDKNGKTYKADDEFTLNADDNSNILYAQWLPAGSGEGTDNNSSDNNDTHETSTSNPSNDDASLLPTTGDSVAAEAALLGTLLAASLGVVVAERRRKRS